MVFRGAEEAAEEAVRMRRCGAEAGAVAQATRAQEVQGRSGTRGCKGSKYSTRKRASPRKTCKQSAKRRHVGKGLEKFEDAERKTLNAERDRADVWGGKDRLRGEDDRGAGELIKAGPRASSSCCDRLWKDSSRGQRGPDRPEERRGIKYVCDFVLELPRRMRRGTWRWPPVAAYRVEQACGGWRWCFRGSGDWARVKIFWR